MPENEFDLTELTPMQRRFVDAYVATWSKSEAAHRAGYKLPDKQGIQIYNRSIIQAAIRDRLQHMELQTPEVLARLAQMARANIADFLIHRIITKFDKNGNAYEADVIDINWENVQKFGYLIKKLTWNPSGNPVIELHDSQVALVNIGKHLGLFGDSLDVNFMNSLKAYIGISPDDWDDNKQ